MSTAIKGQKIQEYQTDELVRIKHLVDGPQNKLSTPVSICLKSIHVKQTIGAGGEPLSQGSGGQAQSLILRQEDVLQYLHYQRTKTNQPGIVSQQGTEEDSKKSARKKRIERLKTLRQENTKNRLIFSALSRSRESLR